MKSSEQPTEFEDNIPEQFPDPSPTLLDSPPRKARWILVLLGLVLSVGGGGFALWRVFANQSSPQKGMMAQPPARVKLAAVGTGSVEDTTEFIASLQSRRSVTLQPRVQGQINQIFVRSGTSVAEGTPILQIEQSEQQAAVSSVSAAAQATRSQLDNSKAILASLEAERLSRQSDVKLNQREYQRYVNLTSVGAVSRQVREQYANRLATAQANLENTNARIQAQRATITQAEKAVKQAEANIKQKQVELGNYTITAPFSGTIGDIPVKQGQFVNTSTQLFTITQNQPLEVNISVPIERALQLQKGMPVEIMDAQGKLVGVSRVSFISPNVSNNTQSVLIKALYDNSRGQLRADQFARAKVIWNRRTGVVIPTTAVSRVAGETFVFVAENQTNPQGKSQQVARQKRVKLGDIRGNNYQVLDGLQPGEKIIVSGILNLRDGAPIAGE